MRSSTLSAVGLAISSTMRPSARNSTWSEKAAELGSWVTMTIVWPYSSTELLGFMRRSVDEYGQTIVMVTHDPNSAAFADHVLFLADGRIVDEMANPTAEKVLDLMKKLGG